MQTLHFPKTGNLRLSRKRSHGAVFFFCKKKGSFFFFKRRLPHTLNFITSRILAYKHTHEQFPPQTLLLCKKKKKSTTFPLVITVISDVQCVASTHHAHVLRGTTLKLSSLWMDVYADV